MTPGSYCGRGLILFFASMGVSSTPVWAQPTAHKWAVVIHGGAGVITRESMDANTESAYRASMRQALETAAGVLNNGGSAVDAVERAILLLEDDPLFNAGRGAVFAANGTIELDAAIMNGATLQAGSVAGVTRTRHPIALARTVMEKSPHVMLIGGGADAFAQENRLEQVDQSFFFTERRWQELIQQLQKDGRPIPPRPPGFPRASTTPQPFLTEPQLHGTVGVAALDRQGNLAAGTSTGGTTGKRPGRVGDTPIIGAGTYANSVCAVSGTGVGEYFIRLTVAREICALVQYRKMTVEGAANEIIQKRLAALKGDGGAIVLGANGQIAWSFNTAGMYRARQQEGGQPKIAIFKEEQ